MKYCRHCQTLKPFDALAKKNSKLSGFMSGHCWDCYKQYKCKELLQKRSTPEGKLKARLASAKSLTKPGAREKANAKSLLRSLAWAKANRGLANAKNAKRRASLLQRTPSWADLNAIAIWYKVANALNLEVDHIIPLNGRLVSGLHVHTNLQFLTRNENAAKGAKYDGSI